MSSVMVRMGSSPRAPAVHCMCWGVHREGAEKRGLILVHGFNQSAHSWDEVAPEFHAKGFTVVAMDQRGHGLTTRCNRSGYSREHMAADIGRVADHFRFERFSLVGMSLGAVHSIQWAAEHWRRLHSLVLVDNAPEVERQGVEKIAAVAAMQWPSLDAAIDAMHAFNPQRSKENLRSRLSHTMAQDEQTGHWTWRVDPEFVAARFDPVARRARAGDADDDDRDGDNEAQWARLASIRCPVLLVRGAQSDVLSESMAQRVVSVVPHATLATVANAGHSVSGDNPSGFLSVVLPFLASCSSSNL